MRTLIARNSAHAPEGAFGEWLAARGHAISVTSGEALDEAAARNAELLVLLGSPHGVYDTHIPWIARQREQVAARLAARRPIIGICFGAQMIAAAAGGESARLADGRFFRGWFPIEEATHPAFAGPWPRWHGDGIAAPPGAEILARDAGTLQAFALPRAIGVQFHPEATPEILNAWATRFTPPGVVDIGALDAASAAHFPARAAARDALFAEMLRRATEG
jgi:GMP synthase (glutamine-hydrolysing)